jgi:hypothetical protein
MSLSLPFIAFSQQPYALETGAHSHFAHIGNRLKQVEVAVLLVHA